MIFHFFVMKQNFTKLYRAMGNAYKYAKPALLCNAKLKMKIYRKRSIGNSSVGLENILTLYLRGVINVISKIPSYV